MYVPESCAAYREVRREALTGGVDRPAIEPRKKLVPECRRFLFDGRQQPWVRDREHLRARRGR